MFNLCHGIPIAILLLNAYGVAILIKTIFILQSGLWQPIHFTSSHIHEHTSVNMYSTMLIYKCKQALSACLSVDGSTNKTNETKKRNIEFKNKTPENAIYFRKYTTIRFYGGREILFMYWMTLNNLNWNETFWPAALHFSLKTAIADNRPIFCVESWNATRSTAIN